MKKTKKNVLVVGAGLAGLAMYLALDKNKFDVVIIEKRRKFKRLGFSLIFMPLGSIALKHLGFNMDEIRRLGTSISKNVVRNVDGTIKRITDYAKINKRFGKYMIITRQRLYDLLEKSVPAKAIRFGVKVESLPALMEKYDIIIGADGINSEVRSRLFPDVKLNDLKQTLIWTWIPRKKGIYPKHGGLGGVPGVGFFNSGEKDKSCVAFFVGSDTKIINSDPKNYPSLLRTMFANFKGPLPKMLKYLPKGQEMYLQRDYEIDLSRWYRKNVVLIGDAAHARSAFSGAGSSLAIEDAIILGDLLNKTDRSKLAFAKYQNIQAARIKKMAMANVSLYFQDQSGVEEYLSDFISSSILYRKNAR